MGWGVRRLLDWKGYFAKSACKSDIFWTQSGKKAEKQVKKRAKSKGLRGEWFQNWCFWDTADWRLVLAGGWGAGDGYEWWWFWSEAQRGALLWAFRLFSGEECCYDPWLFLRLLYISWAKIPNSCFLISSFLRRKEENSLSSAIASSKASSMWSK